MTLNPDANGEQIARKTTRAILWNYASFGLGKFLTFLTTAVLARILTQSDFGIVALATIATEILIVFKDLGLGDALIQNRDDPEEAANTVFTMDLLLGVVLTGIGLAAAPLVAAYFRQPLVTPLLRVLSFSFVLNALGDVQVVLLRRELAFNKKLIPDTVRSLVKGIVAITLALSGAGAWALVIGQMAGVVGGVAVSWLIVPWRPRLRIAHGKAVKLLRFGVSLLFVDTMTVLEDNLDYIIIGRQLGEAVLGVYTLAYRLPEVLIISLLWVIARAIFPAYASMQNQPALLRQGFLSTIRYLGMFATPICVGLMLAADPIIRVAFGPNWLDAIPMLRVLAAFALMTSIGYNVGDIYKAVGRPDILIRLSLVYVSMLVPAMLIGVRYGAIGVALGHLVVATINMVIRLVIASRMVKVSLGEVFAQLKPSLISGAVCALVTAGALALTGELVPLIRLGIVAFVGASGYLAALWVVEGQSLLDAASKVGIPGLKRLRQETGS